MNLKPYEIVKVRRWIDEDGGHQKTDWQYKNVPMEKLTTTKRLLKSKGLKYRIRYRGPRCSVFDTRPARARKQDCLKRFANRFTVYILEK
jgi:hypothetical protein